MPNNYITSIGAKNAIQLEAFPDAKILSVTEPLNYKVNSLSARIKVCGTCSEMPDNTAGKLVWIVNSANGNVYDYSQPIIFKVTEGLFSVKCDNGKNDPMLDIIEHKLFGKGTIGLRLEISDIPLTVPFYHTTAGTYEVPLEMQFTDPAGKPGSIAGPLKIGTPIKCSLTRSDLLKNCSIKASIFEPDDQKINTSVEYLWEPGNSDSFNWCIGMDGNSIAYISNPNDGIHEFGYSLSIRRDNKDFVKAIIDKSVFNDIKHPKLEKFEVRDDFLWTPEYVATGVISGFYHNVDLELQIAFFWSKYPNHPVSEFTNIILEDDGSFHFSLSELYFQYPPPLISGEPQPDEIFAAIKYRQSAEHAIPMCQLFEFNDGVFRGLTKSTNSTGYASAAKENALFICSNEAAQFLVQVQSKKAHNTGTMDHYEFIVNQGVKIYKYARDKGCSEFGAALVVGHAAQESFWGNSLGPTKFNNYFGLLKPLPKNKNNSSAQSSTEKTGTSHGDFIMFSSLDGCLEKYFSSINDKWPAYIELLKTNSTTADKIDAALNTGNHFKSPSYCPPVPGERETYGQKIYNMFASVKKRLGPYLDHWQTKNGPLAGDMAVVRGDIAKV